MYDTCNLSDNYIALYDRRKGLPGSFSPRSYSRQWGSRMLVVKSGKLRCACVAFVLFVLTRQKRIEHGTCASLHRELASLFRHLVGNLLDDSNSHECGCNVATAAEGKRTGEKYGIRYLRLLGDGTTLVSRENFRGRSIASPSWRLGERQTDRNFVDRLLPLVSYDILSPLLSRHFGCSTLLSLYTAYDMATMEEADAGLMLTSSVALWYAFAPISSPAIFKLLL